MKKLMFAAAVMVAGVAMAEFTSNTVGYQINEVPQGKSLVTPTFLNLSGETMPIDSFVCRGVGDGEAMIQVINADGTWGKKAFWFNAYESFPAGWCEDAQGLNPSDIELTPGQGVSFTAQNEGGSVQSAGAVPESDVIINVPQGKSMIGNVSTVTIAIDKMQLENVGDGEAMLQLINANGKWGKKAFWFNAFDDFPAGWCEDAQGLNPSDIELAPGQAVSFTAQNAGGKAHIPSAMTK